LEEKAKTAFCPAAHRTVVMQFRAAVVGKAKNVPKLEKRLMKTGRPPKKRVSDDFSPHQSLVVISRSG